ncbi:hypothetical protein HMPREF7545_1323 [Selenomonas noxia ATCC 43541]|nr:hypothetical protein HMPREF7545_1323 [Selenomonas noxia ATCC 43541]
MCRTSVALLLTVMLAVVLAVAVFIAALSVFVIVILHRQVNRAEVQLRDRLSDRLCRNRLHMLLIEQNHAALRCLHRNHLRLRLFLNEGACLRLPVMIVRAACADDTDEHGACDRLFETRGGEYLCCLIFYILHFHDFPPLPFGTSFIIPDDAIIRENLKQNVNTKITFLKFFSMRRFLRVFRL